MKLTIFLTLFFFSTSFLWAQNTPNYYAKGDSAYKTKDYTLSADFYEKHIANLEEDEVNMVVYYNTACSFSLAGNSDKAFEHLDKAVAKGWKSMGSIQQDEDFNNIHADERWEKILEKVQENLAAYEATLKYPKIRREIREMRHIDQKLRRESIQLSKEKGSDSPEVKAMWKKIAAVDHKNTERMKEIIAEIGWPKTSEVGDATGSAWLLVQHADQQPDFQKTCLPLIQAAVEEGEARGSNYAYLYDRVMLAQGQKQLYGSQGYRDPETKQMSFRPIEEEHLIVERRAKYKMGDISAYAKRLGFDYQVPTEKEALKKDKGQKKTYRTAIKKGMKAYQQKDYLTALMYYRKALSLNGNFTSNDVLMAASIAAQVEKEESSAFRHLNQACLMGWKDKEALKNNADLKPLQDDERWKELLAKFGE